MTILVNGDFETGDFTGWTELSNPMETSGCDITSTHIRSTYVGIPSAQSGMYFSAGGCPTPPGTGLEQTITLNAGQLYTVTAYYNAGAFTPSGGALYIDGTSIATAAFTDANWHQVTATFTASSSSVTFAISFYNGPYESAWDNIVIV